MNKINFYSFRKSFLPFYLDSLSFWYEQGLCLEDSQFI